MGRATFIANVTGRPRRLAIDKIIEKVCESHQIRREDLLSDRRTARFTRPRQQVMFLAKRAGFTPSAIGRKLNRDHTTVLHGIKSHAQRHNLMIKLD
jgi:chromosomal replication initiation ATPase DnaA